MKQCPTCKQQFTDDLSFCLQDGTPLSGYRAEISYAGEQPTVVGAIQPAASPSGIPVLLWLGPILIVILIVGVAGAFLLYRSLAGGAGRESAASKEFESNRPTVAVNDSPSPTPQASPTPTPVPTPDKIQLQTVMDQSIKRSVGKMGAGETNKRTRRIVYGDLDNDGVEEVVVQYDWDFSKGGGNGSGSNISVFKNNGGKYELVADEEVGGKDTRTFKLIGVKNGKILADTLSYPSLGGECDEVGPDCVQKKVQFVLSGKKLIEK
jgi:hypothetical protein